MPTPKLRLILQTICAALGFEADVELSLVCTGDRGMRQLNRQWRHKDRSTDVLSFPQWDAAAHGLCRPRQLRGQRLCLGDVVLSMPTAKLQADALGHSLAQEVCRLLVHGVLHLMGHDHVHGGAQARRMQAAERRLLARLQQVW